VPLHLPVEIGEKLRLHYAAQTFFAGVAANQVQQEYPDCRTSRSRHGVHRELAVVSGGEDHEKQIGTDRQEEKRIVPDCEQEQPESTEVNEKA